MNFVDFVIALHASLERASLSHAFGGALALSYAATPRGTVDIDVNVFLAPDEMSRVDAAFAGLGLERSPEESLPIAGVRFTTRQVPFPVDVFPSLGPRYDEIERRVARHPFGRADDVLPFLSPEDLCVFKLSFGRPKDWIDLADIAAAQPNLDIDYVEGQLVGLRGPTMYPRLARFRRLLPLA